MSYPEAQRLQHAQLGSLQLASCAPLSASTCRPAQTLCLTAYILPSRYEVSCLVLDQLSIGAESISLMCRRGKRGEEQGERSEGPPIGAGEDDMPPPFLPSAAELGLHLPEDKPNFRKYVSPCLSRTPSSSHVPFIRFIAKHISLPC